MIEVTFSVLMAISIYLLLDRAPHRKIFGIVLLSTVINLVLLLAGKLNNKLPAFIGQTPPQTLSNPIPQALILTAIVIGLGLLIFLCVLFKAVSKEKI